MPYLASLQVDNFTHAVKAESVGMFKPQKMVLVIERKKKNDAAKPARKRGEN
jgi:hypothetical protein